MTSDLRLAKTPTRAVDASFKLLLIGNSGVGKTCMLLRLVDNKYSTSFITTIGIDFKVKTFTVADGKQVRLQVWDTAGQEKFYSITTSYFRGADAVVVVFDPTDRVTFEAIVPWLRAINEYAGTSIQKFLVASKADLAPRWTVSEAEGRELAARYRMPFFVTSAKTNVNIAETFQEIAEAMYDGVVGPPSTTASVDIRGQSQSGRGGRRTRRCC